MKAFLLFTALLAGMAPKTAEVDKIWDFFDDDFQGWMIQEGRWHCEEDALVHWDEQARGGLASMPDLSLRDFTFETDLCIADAAQEDSSVWAGVLFRTSVRLLEGAWRAGYHFLIRLDGRVDLTKADGAVLASVHTDFRPSTHTLRLKVVAQGPLIRGYVNEHELFGVEDDAYAAGGVGLINFGCLAAFDNVHLTGNLGPPAPADAVGPGSCVPSTHPPVDPLPRIGVRRTDQGRGEFYNRETGARFVPKGFNHTRLEEGTSGWHATFNTGIYHPDEIEQILTRMAQLGANTLRVWAWGTQKASGFCGARESLGLNSAYMENFVDFLRRATAHGLYVIPILDEVPHNACYEQAGHQAAALHEDDPKISGYNRQYLAWAPLGAKAACVEDFIRFVEKTDPGLLATVLGWSLANEVFVTFTSGPFSYTEGVVKTVSGKIYDMGKEAERQACYDESILVWANTLADAVKRADPEALVTAGMWTADAHGRPPRNGLTPDGRDPRIPPRPSVLGGASSRLDFIDVHIYPWDGTSAVRAAAHERDAVVKPGMAGEYGVFKDKSPEQARGMLAEMLTQAYAMGYAGDLHWIWDLTGVPGQTWSAVEEDLGAFLMQWPGRPQ